MARSARPADSRCGGRRPLQSYRLPTPIEQLEARRLLAATPTYLSDLDWASAVSTCDPARKNTSANGLPIAIGQIPYAKGVGVHSDSELVYTLGGKYTRFTAAVGMNDSVGDDGSSQFLVYVDGVLKKTSTRRDGSQGAELLDVDLTGAQTMRLVTNTGGLPGDNNYRDQAVWADAMLWTEPAAPLPVVSVGSWTAWVAENATASNVGVLYISRTGATDQPLVVQYALLGTATNGVDYETLSGSLTIPAGSQTASLQVKPIDDAVFEGNETFTLKLSAGTGYAVSTTLGEKTITITENDPEPIRPKVTVTATDPAAAETNAGQAANPGTFTVTRDGDTSAPLTVSFTLGGSAASGSDYAAIPLGVTIPAGQSSAVVTIAPVNDSIHEGSETVLLTLSASGIYVVNPAGGSATVGIADNDPAPPQPQFVHLSDLDWATARSLIGSPQKNLSASGATLTIGGVTYGKGIGLHSDSELLYHLGGKYTRFTSYVGIDDVVGNSPADGSSQFLVYVDGVLKKTSTRRDGSQGAELLDVDLTGAQTLRLVTNAGGLPGDNNWRDQADWADAKLHTTPAVVKPTATIARTQHGAEPDKPLMFTVTRTGDTAAPLTVFLTYGGSASANEYHWVDRIVIPAGQSSATETFPVVDDAVYEGDETVIVSILADDSYAVGQSGSATGTIVDDEPEPTIVTVTATDNAGAESTGSPDPVTFTFTRTGPVDSSLRVRFAIGGSAKPGLDFSGFERDTLTFYVIIPAGQSSGTVTLQTVNDDIYEADETISITLRDDAAYDRGAQTTATAVLRDDDPALRGLTAQYFDNPDFTSLVATRVDPQIAMGDPPSVWDLPMQDRDSFSVRWTGSITAEVSGLHDFSLGTDHGARLWINGKLVVDSWSSGVGNGSIELQAGQPAAILVEYHETSGSEWAYLTWKPPGEARQQVPSRVLLPAAPRTGQPLRILAVGDSITEADGQHASYRFWLDRMLTSTGLNFDFVGSRSGAYNNGAGGPNVAPLHPWFDQDHQSIWGGTLETIDALDTPAADIALIHIGHNDIRGGQSPQSLIDELSAYIDRLRAINPQIKIALAQPVKNTSLGSVAEMDAYRALIPGLVNARSTPDSPIVVVDQYTGFDPATMTYDTVHPNEIGEKQIAERFFAAIQQLRSGLSTPAAAPSNLQREVLSPGSVRLTWSDNSNNEQGFEVLVNGEPRALPPNTTSATILNLTPGETYTFQVRALPGAAASGSVSVTMPTNTQPAISFYKGVNFGGGAVTIDGNAWIGQSAAQQSGLTFTTPYNLGSTSVGPTPGTDPAAGSMLNTVAWRSQADLSFSQVVENGTYDVAFYVMENYLSNVRNFSIIAEGQTVQASAGNMAKGSWQKYGTYRMDVADGKLDVTFKRITGDTHVMGISLFRVTS